MDTQPDLQVSDKGRQRIDSYLRQNSSKRAMNGKLTVEKGFCPRCKHHKVLMGNIISSTGQGIRKCARCKTTLSI